MSDHTIVIIWVVKIFFVWEIDGETVETVSDFIFGGSKITADAERAGQSQRETGRERESDRIGERPQNLGDLNFNLTMYK